MFCLKDPKGAPQSVKTHREHIHRASIHSLLSFVVFDQNIFFKKSPPKDFLKIFKNQRAVLNLQAPPFWCTLLQHRALSAHFTPNCWRQRLWYQSIPWLTFGKHWLRLILFNNTGLWYEFRPFCDSFKWSNELSLVCCLSSGEQLKPGKAVWVFWVSATGQAFSYILDWREHLTFCCSSFLALQALARGVGSGHEYTFH